MDKLLVNNILKQLEEPHQISYSEGFTYAKECSKLIAEQQYPLARKLTIRVLNHWSEMDANLYPIWSEMMESLGFYPYLRGKEDGLETTSLDNNIVIFVRCYHLLYQQALSITRRSTEYHVLTAKNQIRDLFLASM